MVSIDRIYKTKAYDVLEKFCEEEEDFLMCDKYDRQQVVNLLIPIIRKEERERLSKTSSNKNYVQLR